MRYAIISDIHGNLEALEAVIRDIDERSVDKVICLGDIVGYYPDPNDCVDLVKKRSDLCLAGNHDYAAIGRVDTRTFTYYAYAAMEWTKRNISSESKKHLSSLQLTAQVDNMFCTHSSPSTREQWAYVFPDSELAVFEAFNSLVCRLNFIGHTHWPSIMLQEQDKIILHSTHSIKLDASHFYLINVGSVGQPRDFDPRSCYALYDSDEQHVSLIRVRYDFTLTQKKIAANNLPTFLAERLEKGR
ncbi:MAG: metallophosphoesterase [Chitinivibrionales bacterium]|nr:metallophosphoesterase [Chitinivibrionales bacterium]